MMFKQPLALVGLSISLSVNAVVLEVGDLNIIDDTGNPSDGLRYLDMTYSDGLTLTAALSNAQATYANARLATIAEFDDLLLAAGISYDSTLTASSGFEVGESETISTDTDAAALLSQQLGQTLTGFTYIWTDPDGDLSPTSTRDWLLIVGGRYGRVGVGHSKYVPADWSVGFLMVSEVPVPPAAWLFGSALIGLAGIKRKK